MAELALREHWRRDLHALPLLVSPTGISVNEMREKEGTPPGWMQAMPDPDRRRLVIDGAIGVEEGIRRWMALPGGLGHVCSLPLHLDLDFREHGLALGPWEFKGVSVTRSAIRVWFAIQEWFQVPGGVWKFFTDITSVDVPFGNIGLNAAALTPNDKRLLADPDLIPGAA